LSNEEVDGKLVVAAADFMALALELFLVPFHAFFDFSRGVEDPGCNGEVA
jgi:hypothetical protein